MKNIKLPPISRKPSIWWRTEEAKSPHTGIQMSLGDTIDRLTILSRKIYFGEEGA